VLTRATKEHIIGENWITRSQIRVNSEIATYWSLPGATGTKWNKRKSLELISWSLKEKQVQKENRFQLDHKVHRINWR
jgi:hypothetical protein